jgi:hypothetical protein
MKTKALSIKQPFAGLIAAGIKCVENRKWKSIHTPGPLAIVASKAPEPKYIFDDMRKKCQSLGLVFPEELCAINGKCIAVSNVVGIVSRKNGEPEVKDFGLGSLPSTKDILTWWIWDQYGWILNETKIVEPFPVSGRLMLYQIDLPEQERS